MSIASICTFNTHCVDTAGVPVTLLTLACAICPTLQGLHALSVLPSCHSDALNSSHRVLVLTLNIQELMQVANLWFVTS